MAWRIEYWFVTAFAQLATPHLGRAVRRLCPACRGERVEHQCRAENFVQQIKKALPYLRRKVTYERILMKYMHLCQNAGLSADEVRRIVHRYYFVKVRRDRSVRRRIIHYIRCLLDSGARG